jgi:hypothetical protein
MAQRLYLYARKRCVQYNVVRGDPEGSFLLWVIKLHLQDRPLASQAQQPALPMIGWLSIVSPDASPALPFFRRGLAELGYVEGRNLAIEYPWAEFHPERLPALAADLVQSHVSLIAAERR